MLPSDYAGIRDFNPDAFTRKEPIDAVVFDDLWPSESRGSGTPKRNNVKSGAAQGKANLILKASCAQCGFLNNLNIIDHTGGSLDGNGATFVNGTATASFKNSEGTTYTEKYGNPGIHKGSGCAFCGSKNSTRGRSYVNLPQPEISVAPLGF